MDFHWIKRIEKGPIKQLSKSGDYVRHLIVVTKNEETEMDLFSSSEENLKIQELKE